MECDTDKYKSGLIPQYEDAFASIREKRIRLLEIGIHRGGSLLWARKFFSHPETLICGIDILLPELIDDRIRMFQADQNDSVALSAIGKTYGEFDIVIDDGCHFTRETQNTFQSLWDFVRLGGWYIIEDWHAGFREGQVYHGMVELVTDIVRQRHRWKYGETRLLINSKNGSSAWFRKPLDSPCGE